MLPYLESVNQSNYLSSLPYCTLYVSRPHIMMIYRRYAFLNLCKIPQKGLLIWDGLKMAVHEIAFKAGIVGCNRFVVILRYVGHVLKKKQRHKCELQSCLTLWFDVEKNSNLQCKMIQKYTGQLWVRLNTNQTFRTDNAQSKVRLQDNVNTTRWPTSSQDKQIRKCKQLTANLPNWQMVLFWHAPTKKAT